MTKLIFAFDGSEYYVGDIIPSFCPKCGENEKVFEDGIQCSKKCSSPSVPAPDASSVPFEPDTTTVQVTAKSPTEANTATPDPTAEVEKLKEGLDPSQVDAFGGVVKWLTQQKQVLKIGGYAGTGKSHLTSRIARYLELNGHSVCFAAPTGKASLVLREYLNEIGLGHAPCTTVHGLIYQPIVDPNTGKIRGWDRREEINSAIIVIDEASMLTSAMLSDVLSFGRKVLLIGDNGQLPPVGDDNNPLEDGDHMLTKIHRQAGKNPIIHLSKVVRDGAPYGKIERFVDKKGGDKISLGTIEDAIEFTAPDGLIVTFTNNLRTSINNAVRWERFQLSDEDDPAVGEHVICLKNMRTSDGLMIPNGLRGVIESVKDDHKDYYNMVVKFVDSIGSVPIQANKHQFLRSKTFGGFDEVPGKHSSWYSVGALFDFGYAMTAHKVQGSQADKVAVVIERYMLDNCMSPEDRTRWLYTAITRSTDKLMIVMR